MSYRTRSSYRIANAECRIEDTEHIVMPNCELRIAHNRSQRSARTPTRAPAPAAGELTTELSVPTERGVVPNWMTSDVLLTTFWYALTLALHTHTAHARDAGRDGTTTVGATGDGPNYIFSSSFNVTERGTPPPFTDRRQKVSQSLRPDRERIHRRIHPMRSSTLQPKLLHFPKAGGFSFAPSVVAFNGSELVEGEGLRRHAALSDSDGADMSSVVAFFRQPEERLLSTYWYMRSKGMWCCACAQRLSSQWR